ncbi:DUF3833 domain-containing protein [Microbulbifer hydrolyticus]|uniref:DUF3833 family protein n=1 Tax=Microbulbifer hydrolyticus TaxID=48074 RepID=A0A6P1T466_9GAMM|nr:DUF3833 domain-containing protein [Microbulbifer hydrolyticus]MBB5211566.1 hypothetical protein [Microbulbifer hydrolyticus]QHQ37694.1 DUF3833 family protein [Microbulbifer hydrolyticus]
MLRLHYCALLLFASLLIASCGGATVEDYAKREPAFIPEQFFKGDLEAYGVVKDRSGTVTRRFSATLKGSWKDGKGLLAERFEFDDGEIQYRNWHLIPQQQSGGVRRYGASAEDVVGEATVRVSGNAGFFRYTLKVPYGDRQINVDVDDRMYLVNERILIAESDLTKWGFDVGEIILTIIKPHTP